MNGKQSNPFLRWRGIALGLVLTFLFGFAFTHNIIASTSITELVRGYIVLQVEKNGEAWYVSPDTNERQFLGRPSDAFALLSDVGLGISNTNLEQIPIAGSSIQGNIKLRKKLSGRILLQIERNGEAWYVYPRTLQRYYLGRANDAFQIMSDLGLGISNADIAKIPEKKDPVFVGAGDISVCTNDYDEMTAKLLDNIEGTVFTLGDNAYPKGTIEEFNNCYNPTWGRHKSRTYPAIGNHEYLTPQASGYFTYWGSRSGGDKGYYRYSIGDWQIFVLNTNCDYIGGCDSSSVEYHWLKKELELHPSRCSIAYMHHPRFSSGIYAGDNQNLSDMWNLLVKNNVDLALAGHEHVYERLAPLNENGHIDYRNGTRSFVVGTGGAIWSFRVPREGSEVRIKGSLGVLKLTLHSRSYSWDFIAAPGATIGDTGAYACH